ncbi:MAG TPA: Hsp20/alpha crystallin family protein [Mycobacteriales bacterium]
MLMRFDPLREVDRLAQLLAAPAFAGRPATTAMPMDAYREGERLMVVFDLPGVNPDDIEVTVERDSLTVRAERGWQPSEGQEVLVSERPQGVFLRQLSLGANLDADRMQAKYEQGVLTLAIPVSERARPRRIGVSAADGTTASGGAAASSGTASGEGTEAGSGTQQERPAMSGADRGRSAG